MAGSDQSKNLAGMFQMINAPISEMGAAGNQYVDTFRRSMAPRADMNDSASLLRYADWARRNGYDDEAKQYMVLGASQQKLEGEKAYKDQIATGTEKLRGLYRQLARAKATPNADPRVITGIETQINTIQTTLNEAGAASIYGVANAGSIAGQEITSEMLSQERAAVELRSLKRIWWRLKLKQISLSLRVTHCQRVLCLILTMKPISVRCRKHRLLVTGSGLTNHGRPETRLSRQQTKSRMSWLLMVKCRLSFKIWKKKGRHYQ